MKKLGFAIFIVTILIGVAFANLFSFGRASGKVFNFSFGSSIKGSGVAATEVRELSGFNAVDVGGVFQVEITAGKDHRVEIEADDNLLQYIRTEVNGHVLKLSTSESIKPHDPIRVRIWAPSIEDLDASGASKVSLIGINNSDLTVDISGASKIKLEGETRSLSIDASGAAAVDAENLKSENANVDASGASHISVFVTGSLVSEASGASKIKYAGDPTSVEKNSSGAGKIHQK